MKQLKHCAPGKLVKVNGHNMHIFTEGQGDKNIIFMSGCGTCAPTLDFKPLWSLLADNFTTTVIEKTGYGWSDISKTPRDLDTMLAASREALRLAGVHPPYILAPHSLSGLEAVYWAQKYPQEVSAIIGLDPSVPDMADAMKFSWPRKLMLGIVSRLARLPMSEAEAIKAIEKNFPSPSFKSEALTDGDRAAFIEQFQQRTYTTDMRNEISAMPSNANMVRALPLPVDVPVYFFTSNFEEVARQGHDPGKLTGMHKDFLAHFKTAKHMVLDCGHFVHAFRPEIVAGEMRTFVDLNSK